MDATARFSPALVGLVLIGMLLLGGIVLVVALMANRRTRPVGIVLLVVGGGVAVLGVLAVLSLWLYTARSREVALKQDRQQATVIRRSEAEARARVGHGPSWQPALRPPSENVGHVSNVPGTTESCPTAEKPSGVLPAIGNSLAKAASETSLARASRSVRQSPSVLAAALRALSRAIDKERTRLAAVPAEPPKPPAWVDAEPGMVDGAYQITAMVGPFATRQECDEAQPQALEEVAAQYVDQRLGRGVLRWLRPSPEYLRRHVVAATWEEERMTDFGPDIGRKPMLRRYVLLSFNKDVRDELTRRGRLCYAGYGLAAMLAALGLAFAYLKINLATGGRYRGRSRAAAIAVILAVIAASVVVLLAP
jgi:type II secretory pathway pseudopilin PulG